MRSFATRPLELALCLTLLLALLMAGTARGDDFVLDADQIKAALHTATEEEGGIYRPARWLWCRRASCPRDVHDLLHLGTQRADHQFQYFKQALIVRAARHRYHGAVASRTMEFRKLHRWWHRPCGGREVLALAGPLVISTMSFTVMTFIDRMFLTHCSLDAVAAAMPAAMLQVHHHQFPAGGGNLCQHVCGENATAQPRGRGRWDRSSGRGSGSASGHPAVAVDVAPGHRLLPWAHHEPHVIKLEITYYDVLISRIGGGHSGRGSLRHSSPVAGRRRW